MHAWLAFVIALGILALSLAVTGVATFGASSQILIALAVIVIVAAAIGGWLIYAAMKAQYARVKTGKEALIGAFGVAMTDLKPKGEVRILGEFWQAKTAKDTPIINGETVNVIGMDGMFLVVKPAKEKA
jgi:membrane-bound serine protease (ClpP class)